MYRDVKLYKTIEKDGEIIAIIVNENGAYFGISEKNLRQINEIGKKVFGVNEDEQCGEQN